MNEYFSLAPYYDKLMPEEDYRLWADLCEKLFSDLNGKTILDLACGTGRLSFMLADRGFEVIGADISCEMLAVAEAKRSAYKGGIPPLFLNQAAQELDLYGTVQAVVCSMDGINYIEPESIERALSKVSLFLEEGGVFVFDINTPEKFERLDGEIFVDEGEDIYCVWRVDYDPDEGCCLFGMDIFIKDAEDEKLWRREYEEHVEYDYTPQELSLMLKNAGFKDITIYGGLPLREVQPGEDRVFIICKK
jgi:ubiquinone/menaquinone biosynthesis C-methylase UbiE